jgi:hypothetical protein
MSVRIRPWFGVPPALIANGTFSRMSPSDIILCLYLYWKSDRSSSRRFEVKDSEIIGTMGISPRSLSDAKKRLSLFGTAECEKTLGGLYTYTICDITTGRPYPGDPRAPIDGPQKALDGGAKVVPVQTKKSISDKPTESLLRAVDTGDTGFNFGWNVENQQPPTSRRYFDQAELKDKNLDEW